MLLCGFSLVAMSWGDCLVVCMGFSLQWLLLWSTGSRSTGFSSCDSPARERWLSSFGTQTQLLRDMLDLPGPGIETVSPALARGCFTEPPEKPQFFNFSIEVYLNYNVVLITVVQQRDCIIYTVNMFFHVLFRYGLSQDIECRSLYSRVGPCLIIF